MKNQFRNRTIVGALLMILSLMANAQTLVEVADKDKEYVLIKTNNKEDYVGYIATETKSDITLQTDEGNVIFVEKASIKKQLSIKAENIVNGEYWAPNPSTNIITGNAYGLKKGEGFYQNNMIVVHSVGYGLTDNVSISAGFESISLLISQNSPAFFVNGKFTKPISEYFRVGVNGSILNTPGGLGEGLNREVAGMISGVATYGTQNRNITAGINYAIGNNGASAPAFSFAGQFRLSKRFALLYETLVVKQISSASITNGNITTEKEFKGTSMGGLRFLGDQVIIDSSIWFVGDIGIGIPMMSIRIPFGNRS